MPLGESMMSVLKSNKNLKLIKENRFKSIAKWRNAEKREFDFPEATLQVLREIRERLKKERKQNFYKRLIVYIILVSFLSVLLFI